MRRLITIILLLIGGGAVLLMAQTSDNPLWFDGNPLNDPDEPNHCFIYWDCETEYDWQNGLILWRGGTSRLVGYRLPPTRTPLNYGDFNLCWSVWLCRTEAEWLHGWQRGNQIFYTVPYVPPTPRPSPSPTRTPKPKPTPTPVPPDFATSFARAFASTFAEAYQFAFANDDVDSIISAFDDRFTRAFTAAFPRGSVDNARVFAEAFAHAFHHTFLFIFGDVEEDPEINLEYQSKASLIADEAAVYIDLSFVEVYGREYACASFSAFTRAFTEVFTDAFDAGVRMADADTLAVLPKAKLGAFAKEFNEILLQTRNNIDPSALTTGGPPSTGIECLHNPFESVLATVMAFAATDQAYSTAWARATLDPALATEVAATRNYNATQFPYGSVATKLAATATAAAN